MAIHPEYADAILSGDKQVEFRKRPPAKDVAAVVIYATAPVKKIVGEFAIADVVVTSPTELWRVAGHSGCISPDAFRSYYAASETAAGIVVGAVRRYPRAISLVELDPEPAVPQSFSYLNTADLERIRILAGAGAGAGAGARPVLARLVHGLARLLLGASPRSTPAEVHQLPHAAPEEFRVAAHR